ncbi:MAG: zf-HC2 domain-containing protein [Acidimicrobiales bacterium]|jgi:anti-sigma factor RsiW
MRVLKWWSREVACRDAVALFSDYIEGALAPRSKAALERHLQACADCERYLDQMRTTIRLVGWVGPGDLSEPAMDELLEVFRRFQEEGLADEDGPAG